ncbi:MAG TPA: His/Gly/Thr/Pro-type tRNA ligase C-terminal domain-containing protein, partial [Thermoleophilaceae bacterium]
HVPDVFVVVAKPEAAGTAFGLATKLRERGLHAELEQAGRSVKGQFKHADRIGARRVAIVGDAIEVKDMASGEQREVAGVDEAVAELAP